MPTPDLLTRFLIDVAGVRGAHVRLDETWRQIRERSGDAEQKPGASAPLELLGQAVAAAALFTAHTKVEGRLSLQLRGTGALRLLFAECTASGTLRGIVQQAEPDDASLAGESTAAATHEFESDDFEPDDDVASGLRAFGDDATLAITIENPAIGDRDPVRYQGLVALETDSLAAALEGYFRQSEQLPTRLLLAADDTRAVGLLLQTLPDDGGGEDGDDDGWNRVCALFETLAVSELLDCPADTLLTRLFHEDGVRLLGRKPLRFGCSCSKERVTLMLQALGEDEARAAASTGVAEIRCEFCGQRYHFDADAIGDLFTTPTPTLPDTPTRLQ